MARTASLREIEQDLYSGSDTVMNIGSWRIDLSMTPRVRQSSAPSQPPADRSGCPVTTATGRPLRRVF